MSVYENSRYTKSKVIQEETGEMWLTAPPSIDPDDYDDNRVYKIEPGDNLWSIAYHKLGASKYFWVIADMNNIMNPFEKLKSGDVLILPSRQTLHEEILS